jgi:hypothetical protein
MSYFLVRLLQKFDRFTLAQEFQPEGSLPPIEWKDLSGRQRFEKVWPSAALTLYVKVLSVQSGVASSGVITPFFRAECGFDFIKQARLNVVVTLLCVEFTGSGRSKGLPFHQGEDTVGQDGRAVKACDSSVAYLHSRVLIIV